MTISKKSHLALGALDAVAETSEQFAKFQAGKSRAAPRC